jgi:hypothetical protein
MFNPVVKRIRETQTRVPKDTPEGSHGPTPALPKREGVPRREAWTHVLDDD